MNALERWIAASMKSEKHRSGWYIESGNVGHCNTHVETEMRRGIIHEHGGLHMEWDFLPFRLQLCGHRDWEGDGCECHCGWPIDPPACVLPVGHEIWDLPHFCLFGEDAHPCPNPNRPDLPQPFLRMIAQRTPLGEEEGAIDEPVRRSGVRPLDADAILDAAGYPS